MAWRNRMPMLTAAIWQAAVWLAPAGATEPPAWPPPPDRVALLPPVEFNLEEGFFASEPIADADP